MWSKFVCRTCLASSIKMYDLMNTQLQGIFEKLTGTELSAGDGRSRVCYICYAQLQRCRRFLDMSQKAEQIFKQVVTEEFVFSEQSMIALRASNFIVIPVSCMSLPDHPTETLVTVKIEPADIKEEVEVDSFFEIVKIEDSPSPIPEVDDLMKVCEQASMIENIKIATETYPCQVCNKTFTASGNLNRHYKEVHEKFAYKCDECHMQFSRRLHLKSHEDIHERNRVVDRNTEREAKSAVDRNIYEAGIVVDRNIEEAKSVADRNTYEAKSIVDRNTSEAGNVVDRNIQEAKSVNSKNHKRNSITVKSIHTDEVLCVICNRMLSKRVFATHMRKHTKPYKCDVCEKSFSELSTLRKHVSSHSDHKPFICGACNKGFSHKTYLITHIRTHTGEKPYRCHACPKTFAQIGHLISHRRTHDHLKLYTCSQCGDSFSLSSGLKKHLKTHGEFGCRTCGKTFALRRSLERHEKTHGVRMFACDVCDKTFLTKNTLNVHKRSHTGEKPYCLCCGKTFTTNSNLNKHVKRHMVDV